MEAKEMAKLIKKLMRIYKMGRDYGLFYDGVMDSWTYVKGADGLYQYKKRIKKGVNPKDHCKWFGDATGQFYMGMWFDGDVYRMFHGFGHRTALKKLEELLNENGYEMIFPDYTHMEIIPIA